jgi:hypothetical protein
VHSALTIRKNPKMMVVQDKFIDRWLCGHFKSNRHIGTTALLNTWARQMLLMRLCLAPLFLALFFRHFSKRVKEV